MFLSIFLPLIQLKPLKITKNRQKVPKNYFFTKQRLATQASQSFFASYQSIFTFFLGTDDAKRVGNVFPNAVTSKTCKYCLLKGE